MYKPSPILSPILFFPGLLFEAIVVARNQMYSMKLLASRRLSAPVVSVGNLTLGGAGKTPLVIYISTVLRKLGAIPALLSRGYGRLSPGEEHILPPGNEIPEPALNLGDEPALIRRHVPEIWLGISIDRYSAGCRILKRRRHPVFILDDAFQHHKLQRDLNIVLIDRRQAFESNHVFPRGTLREPIAGLRRADIVVLNGARADGRPDPERAIREIHPTAKIFHCTQEIESFVPLPAWREGTKERSAPPPASAFIVGALGNPQRFLADVERVGVTIKGARFYKDHFRIGRQDWISCAEAASSSGSEAIVTTEKDAIKMSQTPAFPVLVAVQATSFAEHAEFEQVLKTLLEKARGEDLPG